MSIDIDERTIQYFIGRYLTIAEIYRLIYAVSRKYTIDTHAIP